MVIALYIMAGWLALGVLLTITLVGKPRKPITPGMAAWVTLSNAFWIVLIILAAMHSKG